MTKIKTPTKLASGFTLIELMITVAIIAVLAGLAYASYSSSTEKARRTDAKSSLLQIAALQEKRYFQLKAYTKDLTTISDNGNTSNEGYYTLSVATDAATTGCSSDGTCFLLTATAPTTSPQHNDTSCRSFTLSNAGEQKAYDSGNTEDTVGLCW